MSEHPLRVTISPSEPAIDTLLGIRVTGVAPGAIVAVDATQHDPAGRRWVAGASFVADDSGVVDTTSDAPLAGSYEGFDAMGLVWSMTTQDVPSEDGRIVRPLDPVTLTVTARSGAGPTAVASIERAGLPAGVARVPMHGPGVVGALFHPEDGGPHPGVLLLSGAEGGSREVDGALLAAHGFCVLALAYFGADGMPDSLVDLPLESFGMAIDVLLAHPEVRGDRVGVMGGSRGGEAALLIGATFPRVGAVVSNVGSGMVTAGIRAGATVPDMLHTDAGSWTWRGRAIPHLRHVLDRDIIDQVESGEPVELARAYRTDLASRRDLAAAAIPVERIKGPVLLLSAIDDRWWPSAELSDIALRRLERHAHPFPFLHVRYPHAGHAITAAPYCPTPLVVAERGVRLAMGGTVPATADARVDAWLRTIAWFAEHLPR